MRLKRSAVRGDADGERRVMPVCEFYPDPTARAVSARLGWREVRHTVYAAACRVAAAATARLVTFRPLPAQFLDNMEKVIELNEQNFDTQVLQATQPVLVDFWAPWCGPCRMQHPILETVAARVNGWATVAKVNVDDAPRLAERYRITSIPTLLLFKNGEQVRQMVGVQSESTLVNAMEAMK